MPTRANNQPAFGGYRADPHTRIARVHSLVVLTLAADRICAITRFGDNNLFSHSGCPGPCRASRIPARSRAGGCSWLAAVPGGLIGDRRSR